MAIKKPTPATDSKDSKSIKSLSTRLSLTKPNANPSEKKPKKEPCCMGIAPCGSSSTQGTLFKPVASEGRAPDMKKGPKTRIVIKYDVGFGNWLSLRGKGANLSWERGVSLKNLKADEWVWETEALFTTCEFKVLINDRNYETGDNHTLSCGANIQYIPRF